MKHHKTLLAALVITVFALGLGYFAANGSLFMGALHPVRNNTILPDLIIEEVIEGSHFSFRVKNIGGSAVNNPFTEMNEMFAVTDFDLGDSINDFYSIDPDDTVFASPESWTLPVFKNAITFCVDPQNLVWESNENNNCYVYNAEEGSFDPNDTTVVNPR